MLTFIDDKYKIAAPIKKFVSVYMQQTLSLSLPSPSPSPSLYRYDLYDIDIVPHDKYTGHDESINQAPPGFHFVKLSLGEMLFEGNMQIRYVYTCTYMCMYMYMYISHVYTRFLMQIRIWIKLTNPVSV